VNELKAFLAMLERAGIGHGTREDHNPEGTAVQVETDNQTTDWFFDADGKLIDVLDCD
jgi:hypothetical protein